MVTVDNLFFVKEINDLVYTIWGCVNVYAYLVISGWAVYSTLELFELMGNVAKYSKYNF